MSPRANQVATALLLVFGLQIWLVLGHGEWGTNWQIKAALFVLVLSLLPPIHRRVHRVLTRLRTPAATAQWITALTIFFLSLIYLYSAAVREGRCFAFTIQDEYCYAIQTRMLATGRLWMPAHQCAESFESFYLFHRPVYASMYFPGTALLYVPLVWVKAPWWIGPWIFSGLTLAVLYLVVTQLVDGVAALLSVIVMISLDEFRRIGLMLYSHVPLLLLGLLMILVWLKWRQNKQLRWAAVLGALAGWAAITRPLDGVVFALPVGLAMLLDMRSLNGRRCATTVAIILASASPFLLLELITNHGITGSWLTTPQGLYTRLDYPGAQFGIRKFDPTLRPASSLPQKHAAYQQWVVGNLLAHQPDNFRSEFFNRRLYLTLLVGLPNALLLILVPVGLIASVNRNYSVLVATLPLFLILNALYSFFITHYAVITAPALIVTVLLGARHLRITWPRLQAPLETALTLLIIVFSLGMLPEFNRYVFDELKVPERTAIRAAISKLPHTPALILFKYHDRANPLEEPVYNDDVAWPDDAPIIKAHYLSPDLNQRLLRYYALRDSNRHVYVVDRPAMDDSHWRYCGQVKDLLTSGAL